MIRTGGIGKGGIVMRDVIGRGVIATGGIGKGGVVMRGGIGRGGIGWSGIGSGYRVRMTFSCVFHVYQTCF